MTTRRPVVMVIRALKGWNVALFTPTDTGHRLDRVLERGFELRKLADQYAKAYRSGTVKP